MLDVSTEFNDAMKAENRRFETRIKIGNQVYTKKDINSWMYTGGSISGETFQIGSTFSNAIKIEFCSILEGITELTEVSVELGIATFDADYHYDNIPPAKVGSAKVGFAQLIHYKPTVYEYVSMGTFYVTTCDPDRNEKKTTLEASDRFLFLEDEYVSTLSYPASLRDVALEIANKSGSVINVTNFSMIGTALIAKPEGYTYRQAMGLIAQFEAGYARFNRKNELEVNQLVDPKFSISPSEYFQKGLTKNELLYQVGGISCTVSTQSESGSEQVTYSAGSNTGPQIVLDNKVMTQALLESIYQKVKSLNFYPYSLSWRGNPALEMGDWLTLTDREGSSFKVPNLSYTLTFRGGLTAISSANTNASAQTVSAYSPPLNQVIKEFYSRLDAAGKNSVYDGLEEPPYPKEGDIWFKKNGPDDEIWIYSKLEDGTYGWVMTTSTRLSDEIQEKIDHSVPSDEIVKTINLSQEMEGKEWLKITGAKIWLTDQTRIDDAIIQDAMIGSLSASKINAGILNAATVDVINLNASNISTGTLRAIDISGVSISGSSILSQSAGSASNILLNGGTMAFTNINGLNVGLLYPSLDADTKSANGLAINQVPGYNFSLNTQKSKTDATSTAVFQIPTDSSLDNPKANFYGTKTFNGKNTFNSNSYFNDINGLNSVLWISASTRVILSGNGGQSNALNVYGSKVDVLGDFTVYNGSKNAAHVTRDGLRATPAYEMAESYLGDLGSSETDDQGEITILIDGLFSDAVNITDYEYQVFLQSYGTGEVYVKQRTPFSFVVKSSVPHTPFAWELKAKRRGYEQSRLELCEMTLEELKKIEEGTRE